MPVRFHLHRVRALADGTGTQSTFTWRFRLTGTGNPKCGRDEPRRLLRALVIFWDAVEQALRSKALNSVLVGIDMQDIDSFRSNTSK